MDVGCGDAYKLVKYVYPVYQGITGIDQDHGNAFCKDHYSCGEWLVDDIEYPRSPSECKCDLTISADIMKHLIEPTSQLEYTKSHAR